MSKEIIKISEEQARDMLNIVSKVPINGISKECNIKDIIIILREKGYIKISPLEEAEEYYNSLRLRYPHYADAVKCEEVIALYGCFKRAIEEILNK